MKKIVINVLFLPFIKVNDSIIREFFIKEKTIVLWEDSIPR